MVSPSSDWYFYLDTVADSVTPMLTFATIVILLRNAKRAWRLAAAQTIAALLGLAGIYAARAVAVDIAARAHTAKHYSTHVAYAASMVVDLLFLTSRRALLIAILIAYAALAVFIGYHTMFDVVVASAVGVIVTVPWLMLAARRSDNVTQLTTRLPVIARRSPSDTP